MPMRSAPVELVRARINPQQSIKRSEETPLQLTGSAHAIRKNWKKLRLGADKMSAGAIAIVPAKSSCAMLIDWPALMGARIGLIIAGDG